MYAAAVSICSKWFLIASSGSQSHTHRHVSLRVAWTHPHSSAHHLLQFGFAHFVAVAMSSFRCNRVFVHISVIPLHCVPFFPLQTFQSFTRCVCVCVCMSGNCFRLCRTTRISFDRLAPDMKNKWKGCYFDHIDDSLIHTNPCYYTCGTVDAVE